MYSFLTPLNPISEHGIFFYTSTVIAHMRFSYTRQSQTAIRQWNKRVYENVLFTTLALVTRLFIRHSVSQLCLYISWEWADFSSPLQPWQSGGRKLAFTMVLASYWVRWSVTSLATTPVLLSAWWKPQTTKGRQCVTSKLCAAMMIMVVLVVGYRCCCCCCCCCCWWWWWWWWWSWWSWWWSWSWWWWWRGWWWWGGGRWWWRW